MAKVLFSEINSLDDLRSHLDEYLFKFVHNAATSRLDSTHIVSLGCGILASGHYEPLGSHFRKNYGGLFQKGLDQNSWEKISSIDGINTLFTDCFHDPNKKQLKVLNIVELEEAFNHLKIESSNRKIALDIFSNSLMGADQIVEYLKGISQNDKPTYRSLGQFGLNLFGTNQCRNYYRTLLYQNKGF